MIEKTVIFGENMIKIDHVFRSKNGQNDHFTDRIDSKTLQKVVKNAKIEFFEVGQIFKKCQKSNFWQFFTIFYEFFKTGPFLEVARIFGAECSFPGKRLFEHFSWFLGVTKSEKRWFLIRSIYFGSRQMAILTIDQWKWPSGTNFGTEKVPKKSSIFS